MRKLSTYNYTLQSVRDVNCNHFGGDSVVLVPLYYIGVFASRPSSIFLFAGGRLPEDCRKIARGFPPAAASCQSFPKQNNSLLLRALAILFWAYELFISVGKGGLLDKGSFQKGRFSRDSRD